MRQPSILLVALLAYCGCVQAKEKPKGPPLDREQLQRCVFLDDEIERQRTLYNVQVREGNELVKQQAQMRGELDQMKMAIDAGETYRLDAYNAKVEEHNAIGSRHDEYEVRMAEISEKQRLAAEEFNRSCAGRTYRNADFLQVKRRKK